MVQGGRLEGARAAMARGDLLIAYDEASAHVEEDAASLEAAYLVALALARSGATQRAAIEAERLQQQVEGDASLSPQMREDIEALGARVAKDEALRETGSRRAHLAAIAAYRYEQIGRRLRRSYSCINAATLWSIAGEQARALELAALSIDLATADEGRDGPSYWTAATLAEAALVLGDEAGAVEALERSVGLEGADLGARAATRRQLLALCELRGIDPSVLDALDLPRVLHFCGHTIGPDNSTSRFPANQEPQVAADVVRFLDTYRVGIAYGSLACGADIIIAEALLEAGAELNVILPFDADEFETVSVLRGGVSWGGRYRACLEAATSVIQSSDSAYLGDDVMFAYASDVAMGHALNRALVLGTNAIQLAVSDGTPDSGPAGTARDMARWQAAGRETITIPLPPARPEGARRTTSPPMGRSVRAFVFTDLRGFSRLRDEQYLPFLEGVIAPIGDILDRYGAAIATRKTWGDAVHIVCGDVATAARAALDIQDLVAGLDLHHLGLPDDLEMRVGAHAGPALEWHDPVDGKPSWWGRELTRAARIEPRTPEGEVYVTDAFASLLVLENAPDLRCEYVGRVATAKDFETILMYRLCRSCA